jgi:hypothetical protein
LGNCEYRRILAVVGVDGEQLVIVVFLDLEGDCLLICDQGFINGGLDV